jgi:hypothetical protein
MNDLLVAASIVIFGGDDWAVIYHDGQLIWADHPGGTAADMHRAYEAAGHEVARTEVHSWESQALQSDALNSPHEQLQLLLSRLRGCREISACQFDMSLRMRASIAAMSIEQLFLYKPLEAKRSSGSSRPLVGVLISHQRVELLGSLG